MEQFRERFIGMVGHDLRNPLATIKLSALTLKDLPHMDDDHRNALTLIEEGTERMAHLVSDLLDFTRSRIEGKDSLCRQHIPLLDLCRRVAEAYRVTHPDRSISFSLDPEHERGEGEWNSDRMTQVFSNLIGNALQYGSEDTPVHIGFTGGEDWIHISIHNGGPPIPQDQLKRIFEPFFRGANHNKPSESLGLGLYIVERILHAHNGSICVSSSHSEGTTFTLLLPRGNQGGESKRIQ